MKEEYLTWSDDQLKEAIWLLTGELKNRSEEKRRQTELDNYRFTPAGQWAILGCNPDGTKKVSK